MDNKIRRRAQDFSSSLSTIGSQTPNTSKWEDLFEIKETNSNVRATTLSTRNSEMRKSFSVPDIILPENEKFFMNSHYQYKSFDDSIFVIEQKQRFNEEKVNSDWETFNSHAHFIRSSESEYGSAQSSILPLTPRRRYPGVRSRLAIPEKISHCKSPILSSLASIRSKINSSSEFINSDSISSVDSSSTSSMSRERNSRPTYQSSKLLTPRKIRLRSISPIGSLPINFSKKSNEFLSPGISGRNNLKLKSSNQNLNKKGARSEKGEKNGTRTTQIPIKALTPNILFRGGFSDIPKSSMKENSTPSTSSQRTPTRRFYTTPERSSPCSDRRPKSQTKSYIMGDIDGYNSVKSPVAEYIRGTDMQLVQNVRAKTNMLLLTPRSTGNGIGASCEDLKFKLAKTENDRDDINISSPILNHQARLKRGNTPVSEFNLPKINYELPSQVYEVVENPSKVRGPKSKMLRQVTENRVVTRHENRGIPTLVDSVNQDFADMSIHVTKTAHKTNNTRRFRR